LHDASIENGTLHVLPNSHTKLLDHERDPNSDHHIRCVVPEEEAVALELAAGGVGFFDFGTAHCTRANTTNTARAGLAVHFLHTDFIPESRSSIPTHLTGPHATSGVKEYGRRIEGTWELEVDRVLGATRTIEG
jgi:ectoine hydroxylase-related dioxygenase (phytanoyl-CoA dioxygenase family)